MWEGTALSDAPVKATAQLSFSEALRALKHGDRVARAGWNGKGMWLHYVHADDYGVTKGLQASLGIAWLGQESPIQLLPWIGMKTADDKFVPWLASQTDILAEDWEVVT